MPDVLSQADAGVVVGLIGIAVSVATYLLGRYVQLRSVTMAAIRQMAQRTTRTAAKHF